MLPKSPSSFGSNFVDVSHLLMDFKMFMGKKKFFSMLYNILYSSSFQTFVTETHHEKHM